MKLTLKILLLISALMLMSLPAANAEGASCPVRVLGNTQLGANTNSGVMDFNAHPGIGAGDGQLTDFSIVGLSEGYAPGDRGDAACAVEQTGSGLYDFSTRTYEYAMKGWVWNESIGFISLFCDGTNNNAGGGNVGCGSVKYGVYLSAADAGGDRQLFGYAWSPTFGYIKFDNTGGTAYGVTADVDGNLDGYAWTAAKTYMNFSGARIELTDEFEEPVIEVLGDWCADRPFICIEVGPDPDGLNFGVVGVGVDEDIKLADGADDYRVHIYLKSADGVTPMKDGGFANYTTFRDGIELFWEDSVKLNQLPGQPAGDYSNMRYSWGTSGGGGVTFKPMTAKLSIGDFTEVPGDPDHWISKPITSYAPTTNANLSFTTDTTPAYAVSNENRVFDTGDGDITPNELILKRVEFPALQDGSGTVFTPTPVYPNGKENLHLRFRPAVSLTTLYSNDFKDKITAYRSIPGNIHIELEKLTDAAGFSPVGGNVNLKLGYDEEGTTPGCSGKLFSFNFLENEWGGTTLVDGQNFVFPYWYLSDRVIDYPVRADLQGLLADEEPSCDYMQTPYLSSIITYWIGGKKILYLDNHLPRIAADLIANPVAVIHGNIYAQKVSNIQKDRAVQSSGFVSQDIVRDTLYQNIKTKINVTGSLWSNGKCTITALGDSATVTGCSSSYYHEEEVDGENVIYFSGSDVTIDLITETWTKPSVVIADKGRLFLDSNIDNGADNELSLVLVALYDPKDDDFVTGNVYLGPCSMGITNIQAAIYADGPLYSYDGDHSHISSSNYGLPEFASGTVMRETRSCQLLFEGSLSSSNTIGGAYLDIEGNDYLLLSGGRVGDPSDPEIREQAMQGDINNTRMLRAEVAVRNGLGVDQKCDRELTYDEIKRIANGDLTVTGPRGTCDGLNPLCLYSATSGEGGRTSGPECDLVPPSDGLFADRLNHATQLEPIYLFDVDALSNSTFFDKGGEVFIGQPGGF